MVQSSCQWVADKLTKEAFNVADGMDSLGLTGILLDATIQAYMIYGYLHIRKGIHLFYPW